MKLTPKKYRTCGCCGRVLKTVPGRTSHERKCNIKDRLKRDMERHNDPYGNHPHWYRD